MAHVYEKPSGNVVMKFHAAVKNFKRVERVVFGRQHFKLYIDKNDSVWDVRECEVISWKTIEKGRKKINIPDQIFERRHIDFFNKVKGNPFKVAANKIVAELEYQQLNQSAE